MNEHGQTAGSEPDFDWVELVPPRTLLLPRPGLRIFLVEVKSDTVRGKHLHNHPLDFLRTEIPDMRIPEGARAMVLRANAERSANPRHRSEVWIVDEDPAEAVAGDPTAVGVQFKHPNEDA